MACICIRCIIPNDHWLIKFSTSLDNQLWTSNGTALLNKWPNATLTTLNMDFLDGEEIITKDNKILAVKYYKNTGYKLIEEEWNIIHDDSLGQTWDKGVKSSVGYFTLTSKKYGFLLTANASNLVIQGIVSILLQGVLAKCEFHNCKFHYCGFSKLSRHIWLMRFLGYLFH